MVLLPVPSCVRNTVRATVVPLAGTLVKLTVGLPPRVAVTMSPAETSIARVVVTVPAAFVGVFLKLFAVADVVAVSVVKDPAAAAVPPIAGGEAR
jgi:hypothetical protein